MELVIRAKKPETIKRMMHENNIPVKIIEKKDQHLEIYVAKNLKTRKDTIKKGENVHFFITDEGIDKRIKPEDKSIDIIYEDDYLLIVNKPTGMPVMVSKAHREATLANALMHHFLKHKIKNHIHFVNRLDKESSGLVLIAKHKFIAFLLSDKVGATITRHYHAILDGVLPLKEGCIDLPISRKEGSIEREVSEKGKECKTNYKVEKEFLNKSLVRIRLNKNRTHQVRVHFAHFDAPILGDYIYNPESSSEDLLMLVADRMVFNHPVTDEQIDKKITFPKPFQAYLDKYSR